MKSDMKSFEAYFRKYWDEYPEDSFYDGILELAEMEDDFSRRDPKDISDEEAIKYHGLLAEMLSECPPGTDIENLIGLVVVGRRRLGIREKVKIDYVPPVVKELYDMIGIEP